MATVWAIFNKIDGRPKETYKTKVLAEDAAKKMKKKSPGADLIIAEVKIYEKLVPMRIIECVEIQTGIPAQITADEIYIAGTCKEY